MIARSLLITLCGTLAAGSALAAGSSTLQRGPRGLPKPAVMRTVQRTVGARLKADPSMSASELANLAYSGTFWSGVIESLQAHGYSAPIQLDDYRAQARDTDASFDKHARGASTSDHIDAWYGNFAASARQQALALPQSKAVSESQAALSLEQRWRKARLHYEVAAKDTKMGASERGRLGFPDVAYARQQLQLAHRAIEALRAPYHEVALLTLAREHLGELNLAAIQTEFHQMQSDSRAKLTLDKLTPQVVDYALARAQLRTIERNRRHFPAIDDAKLATLRDELQGLATAAEGSVYMKRLRSMKDAPTP